MDTLDEGESRVLISASEGDLEEDQRIMMSAAGNFEEEPMEPPLITNHVKNPSECDSIELLNGFYHYEFNLEACACFFVFNAGDYRCFDGLVYNPLFYLFPNEVCVTPT